MRIDDVVGSNIEVRLLDRPDGIWVSVSGEIDISNAPEFGARLQTAVADADRPVVLDLGQVTFMDSSGIRELMSLRASLGPRLRVAALHRSVRRILELASLLDQFEPGADGDTTSDRPTPSGSSTGLAANDE